MLRWLAVLALLGCHPHRAGMDMGPGDLGTAGPDQGAVDQGAALLYPTPFYAAQGAATPSLAHSVCLADDVLANHDRLDAYAATLIAAAGLVMASPGDQCDWRIEFLSTLPPDLDSPALTAWAATDSQAGSADRYVVSNQILDGRAHAQLFAENERSALFAITTALSLRGANGRVHGGVVVDVPSIAARGVIEAYYGAPFTRAQRACVLGALSRLRENVYVFGPKDDPYARDRWPDPYPSSGDMAADGPVTADDLKAAATLARAQLIDFYWAVSPGSHGSASGISYASATDFQRLTAKLDAVRALGVTRFALFVDDTNSGLVWPADQAMFATDADAHAYLANEIDDYVTSTDPAAHILFVGRVYTNAANGWDYVTKLGASLHPGISVLWTGPTTYSSTISASDMTQVNQSLGRKAVIWDNEPRFPTALTGRSADLPSAIGGFLSNPIMIQVGSDFQSFWSVLGTLADYAWNPVAYDPSNSIAAWSALQAQCD